MCAVDRRGGAAKDPKMRAMAWLSRESLVGAALLLGAGGTWLTMKFFFKDHLVEKLVHDQVFKKYYDNIEYCITFLLGIIAGTYQFYNLNNWPVASKRFIVATGIGGGLATAIGYGRYLKAHIAAGEGSSIKQLEQDNQLLAQSRDWLVETSQLVDALVTEKFKRIATLLSQTTVNPKDVVSIDGAKRQILIIVQSIHDFFSDRLANRSTLRLGIYFRSPNTPDALELGYSWDGVSEACFSNRSAEYLKTVRTNGVMSELGKCYNSDEGIIIVSDCPAAVREGNFRYLYAGQEEKMKSILVYRCDIHTPSAPPWVIYLDSNQAGFFQIDKKPDYKLFFERVSKRISFELVTLGVASKFP